MCCLSRIIEFQSLGKSVLKISPPYPIVCFDELWRKECAAAYRLMTFNMTC